MKYIKTIVTPMCLCYIYIELANFFGLTPLFWFAAYVLTCLLIGYISTTIDKIIEKDGESWMKNGQRINIADIIKAEGESPEVQDYYDSLSESGKKEMDKALELGYTAKGLSDWWFSKRQKIKGNEANNDNT